VHPLNSITSRQERGILAESESRLVDSEAVQLQKGQAYDSRPDRESDNHDELSAQSQRITAYSQFPDLLLDGSYAASQLTLHNINPIPPST
jgi:hypothetical protein